MTQDSLISADGRFEFQNKELFRRLCGVADAGIADLEDLLDVRLIPRGHAFLIKTPDDDRLHFALAYFETMQERAGDGEIPLTEDFSEFDARYLYRKMKQAEVDTVNTGAELRASERAAQAQTPSERVTRLPGKWMQNSETIFKTVNGKPIKARTERQAEYIASLLQHEITLCMGPAGTGKTFLSIAAACRMFINGDKERLVLTRPAVEAGESLGYLPGDLVQKVDPYLRPLYDALYECLGTERVHDLINTRKIEIAPLAFMRGRTLSNSVVVLDEAQNCTLAQLKMFLTRLGRNSCMCLSGDVTQVDLPRGRSGLPAAVRILENIPGIGVVRFSGEDIIRNPLIERITRAFEKHLESETDSADRSGKSGEL